MGILSVRIRRARAGHNHSGILALGYDRLGAAVKGIEGYEVSAVGLGPGSDLQSAQLSGQDLVHRLKSGTKDRGLFSHMGLDAVQILEETDMAQLIDLIVADHLYVHLLLHIFQVGLGSGDRGNTCAGEGNLCGRTEFINHIRVSGLLALGEDIQNMIRMIRVKMVYAVSVVPENTEVLRGRL